jgi:hypothetical protein
MIVFRDSGEFGPALRSTAEELGIPAAAVEKDYWVSEILRALPRHFGGDFVFKGGTSLSKAYRIVERFSEDVDVLVLPGGRGRGAVDKLMKAMGALAAKTTGGEERRFGDAESGKHRAYEITYPAINVPARPLSATVRLEMGVRGGPHPSEEVEVTCLLGDALLDSGTDLDEFADLSHFTVAVLHPGRTLIEKLALVHGLAQRLADDPLAELDDRTGRHFYDIYQLLGDNRVVALLTDQAEFDSILLDAEEITRANFADDDSEIRPVEGFATSQAFALDGAVPIRLRTAFETSMPIMYFGASELPTWEQICGRVAEKSELL